MKLFRRYRSHFGEYALLAIVSFFSKAGLTKKNLETELI